MGDKIVFLKLFIKLPRVYQVCRVYKTLCQEKSRERNQGSVECVSGN